MPNDVDLSVAELLCSRLCHELISPIGAINNDMEMVRDVDAGMTEEALALVEMSGATASRRLQFYRMAYGRGGTQRLRSVADVRAQVDELFAKDRYALSWTDGTAGTLHPGWGRLILNLLVLAGDVLPRGGAIDIAVGEGERSGSLEASCRGDGAVLSESLRAALAPEASVASLTARTVHAFFLAQLVAAMAGEISAESGPGLVRFTVRAPHP